ncbi:MAG: Gldg family protein [Clostridium sp.]|nr:Gldg family protein [Clostridium sp.]
MTAIYKRELKAYFHSFLGALFIGAMLFLLGIYFSVYNLFMGYPYIGYALSSIVFLFLISIPVLTMRILAEERHQKTDQLILTAPVGIGGIVAGKFLALATIFAIPTVIICIYPLVLSIWGTVSFGESYLAILGFFLYGLACIAIGVFVSSLTESQVIAAVITFGILFLGYIMSGLCNMISQTGNLLTKILSAFDMVSRFEKLLNGSLELTSIVYFLSVILLFLVLTVQSIQKRRYQISSKTLSMSSYSVGVSLVSAAILVLVNFLTAELPAKYTVFDVTANKLYSLTEETKELVEGLGEEVHIYVLANEEQADSTLDATLKNYAGLSSKLDVSYVDPAVNPKFFTAYTDENILSNSVIVESGRRSRVINYNNIYQSEFDYSTYSSNVTGYDGEGQLTSAIAYVTAEEMPKIYMLEGHEELSFKSEFTSAIEKANIDYETINLLQYEAVPEDAECVVLYAPTQDLSEDDTEKLLNYMEKGGDVLLISTYTGKEMPNFNRLLDFYGVQVTEGLVIEGDNSHFYQDPFYLFPAVTYNEITENVVNNGSYVFVPYAQGITLEEREDVETDAFLTTSDESYARNDITASSEYAKQEGDVEGPFYTGVKCEKTLGEETSTAVIYSSEYLFTKSADEIVSGTNLKLFTGTLGSFVEWADSISIPVKSYEVNYLAMTQGTIALLALITVVIIPFAFLITGFVIWFRRRKR